MRGNLLGAREFIMIQFLRGPTGARGRFPCRFSLKSWLCAHWHLTRREGDVKEGGEVGCLPPFLCHLLNIPVVSSSSSSNLVSRLASGGQTERNRHQGPSYLPI